MNPQLVGIVPPTEMIVLVSLDVSLGAAKGTISLCYPFLTIEPVISRLSAEWWYSQTRKRGETTGPRVADIGVEAEVYMEAEAISLRALSRLAKGSLMRLPDYEKGRALLRAGGQPVLALERSRDGEYVVDAGHGADEQIESMLDAGSASRDKGRSQEEHLESAVDKLAGDFKTGLHELGNRISELVSRQGELSDQIYLGAPQKELVTRQDSPFDFIQISDCEVLHNLIGQEHSQIVALILSYLPASLSARLPAGFEDERQVAITERVAAMERVHPDLVREMEKFVAKKLEAAGFDALYEGGGITKAVEILNLSSRSVEKNVITTLEQRNADLAEDLKRRIFVFEDITLLDDPTAAVLNMPLEVG